MSEAGPTSLDSEKESHTREANLITLSESSVRSRNGSTNFFVSGNDFSFKVQLVRNLHLYLQLNRFAKH